ncbi:MAG TPA: T9SS type A sorting domain-containing protein [Bacteroidia bacterium]|nr:T9SS type A sorting domain-containing protein [Bacteroidia bacterium]
MIKKLLFSLLPLACIALLTSEQMSDNGKAGRTGAPGETTCIGCHDDFVEGAGGGSIAFLVGGMPSFQYTPGVTYNMSVTVARSGNHLFGVGIEALTSGNQNAGTLNITNAASTQIKSATVSGVSRRNVVHQLNGGDTANAKIFNFSWTAPVAGTGDVTVYFSGIASNADGDEHVGDYVYSSSQLLTEAGCATPAQPGTITGNTTACSGASVNYSIAAVSGATDYSWTLPVVWTGTSTSTSITAVAGSSAGTISVTANNACGSSTARTLAVNTTAVTGTATATDVTCNGANNGSATVVAGGGTGPYTYAWSPSGGTAATASNLGGGTYTVTITDAGSCTHTSSVSVFEPPVLSATTSSTDASCGNLNGTVTVIPAGGVSPYTYAWNTAPSQTSATATGLGAGNYDVTVTDAYGCTLTASANVNQSASLSATVTQTDVTCFGANDGSATAVVNGGTGPYTYAWSPSGGSGATAANLAGGTYDVTITDGGGCTFTTQIVILEPSELIADAGTTVSGCEGVGITIGGSPTASGGTAPYTYLWDPAAGLNSAGDANPVATLTATTDFTVTITDANGCFVQATTTVGINALPTPVITVNGSMLSTSGGVSYQWYVNGNLIPGAVNPDWDPLVIGDYTVAVTDAGGCVGISPPYTVTTVGITALNSGNAIVIYPNPASQMIHLKTASGYSGSSVRILDITGQEVFQTIVSEQDQVISLSAFAKGMYTLVLDNGTEKKMARFAVSK